MQPKSTQLFVVCSGPKRSTSVSASDDQKLECYEEISVWRQREPTAKCRLKPISIKMARTAQRRSFQKPCKLKREPGTIGWVEFARKKKLESLGASNMVRMIMLINFSRRSLDELMLCLTANFIDGEIRKFNWNS